MSKKRKYQKDRKLQACKTEKRLRELEFNVFLLTVYSFMLTQNISKVESSEISKEGKQTLLDTKDKVDNIYINQYSVTKALSNSKVARKKANELQKEIKTLHEITRNTNKDVLRLDKNNTDIRESTNKKYKELSNYIAKVDAKIKYNNMLAIAVMLITILNILVQIF